MTETLSRRSALAVTGTLATALLGRAAAAVCIDETLPDEPLAAGGATAVYGQGLLVQLPVRDLDRSLRFYTDVLGFRVSERRDDLEFVHVDCGVPGLQLGLSGGDEQPPVAGSVVLNFDVKGDVDAVRADLEKRGVRFSGPTRIIPGKVRLAAFSDPDGYRLRLAGEDPPRG
jgi:catechol 2,3-dioxygenase-like lactoylglutathione lyase family enzyme